MNMMTLCGAYKSFWVLRSSSHSSSRLIRIWPWQNLTYLEIEYAFRQYTYMPCIVILVQINDWKSLNSKLISDSKRLKYHRLCPDILSERRRSNFIAWNNFSWKCIRQIARGLRVDRCFISPLFGNWPFDAGPENWSLLQMLQCRLRIAIFHIQEDTANANVSTFALDLVHCLGFIHLPNVKTPARYLVITACLCSGSAVNISSLDVCSTKIIDVIRVYII